MDKGSAIRKKDTHTAYTDTSLCESWAKYKRMWHIIPKLLLCIKWIFDMLYM